LPFPESGHGESGSYIAICIGWAERIGQKAVIVGVAVGINCPHITPVDSFPVVVITPVVKLYPGFDE
jgi:hypothetical protein